MNEITTTAFEPDEAFEARLAKMHPDGHEWERRYRAAVLWEKRTREEMIAAMNRLAAALEAAKS